MAKPVNLFFPGKPRLPKEAQETFDAIVDVLEAAQEWAETVERRLAALEREAQCNGNGERG